MLRFVFPLCKILLKMHTMRLSVLYFSEGEGRISKKSSPAKQGEWHLGSRLSDSLLGVFTGQSAHPSYHSAWWDGAGSSQLCLQGVALLNYIWPSHIHNNNGCAIYLKKVSYSQYQYTLHAIMLKVKAGGPQY